jgi:hypothetical protein
MVWAMADFPLPAGPDSHSTRGTVVPSAVDPLCDLGKDLRARPMEALFPGV